MKILIIEDEQPAARQLSRMIRELRPEASILTTIDSVEEAVRWFERNPQPDLVFMDIQLADGLSFDIFQQVKLEVPIVFTTAYDQYTLKAFKVNSVDYLLKPLEPGELEKALSKFEQLYNKKVNYNPAAIQHLIQSLNQPDYKKRFIVKVGQQLTFVSVEDINYFYSDDGLVYVRTHDNKKHVVDYTLEQLEEVLRPTEFFRINRKLITRIDAIHKIHTYFNSRLLLELRPKTEFDVIVSRDRVTDFKRWLDR